MVLTQESVLNMSSSNSQMDKPQCGRPERAELPDLNINTDVQSINTERGSLTCSLNPINCLQSLITNK